mmetsp:Transcript_42895/g.127123  ORF Transcript_42895/g.127123 Transcript_42895/m.127123 type:complete len:256 (-) Transcript_42895:504-1271(-)
MGDVERHLVVHEVHENLEAGGSGDARRPLGDGELGGEPRDGLLAGGAFEVLQDLGEGGLLLRAAHLGVAGGVVAAVRAELPAGGLKDLRDALHLCGLAVDDGGGLEAEGLEHAREALEAAAIPVVAPARVRQLWAGLQVGLDAGAARAGREDLHVDDGHDEDLGALGPAGRDFRPLHALAVALGAHEPLDGWLPHEAVLLDKGPRVAELEGEVPVLREAELEAVAVVHGHRLLHGGQRRDHLLRVQHEGGDRGPA